MRFIRNKINSKKLLSGLIASAVTFTAGILPNFNSDKIINAGTAVSATGETVSISSAQALPGETVTLYFDSNNPNGINFDVNISWDNTSGLKLTKVYGTVFEFILDGKKTIVEEEPDIEYISDGNIKVWIGGGWGETSAVDFTVPKDAPIGTTYNIGISCHHISLSIDDGTDLKNCMPKCTSGTITVSNKKGLARGDVNGDGRINVRDAAAIASKLAQGKQNELPESADYNKDNKINVRDAAAIAKFLSGRK